MTKILSCMAVSAVLLVALGLFSVCAQAAEGDAPKKEESTPKKEEGAPKKDEAETQKKEGGANTAKKDGEKEIEIPVKKIEKGDWCEEHGVADSICSRCSKTAAAEQKKKGDWCKKHGRAESQCFICHPELKEKWLALKPKE